MGIWLFQPDGQGNCCACGTRANPCDPCQTQCVPIPITQQDINEGGFVIQSSPSGVAFKFNGVNGQISFSNKNSKLTTTSSSTDYIQLQGFQFDPLNPIFPVVHGFPNQVVNNTFEYQVLVNSGEIVTLYAETLAPAVIPVSQYYPNNPPPQLNPPAWPFSFNNGLEPAEQIVDITPAFCNDVNPPTRNPGGVVIYTSGAGIGSASEGTISFIASNFSGITQFTVGNPGFITPAFTGANAVNPTPYQSSLTYSQVTSFDFANTCPPYSCAFSLNAPPVQGQATYELCYNNIGYETLINPNVLYGNTQVNMSVNAESYFFQNNLVGCSFNGTSSTNCQPVGGGLSQQTTFQIGPIRTSFGTGFLKPASFMCAVINCNNNGFFQLTDSSGNGIDLTTRLVSLNILQNSLP